MDHMLNRAVVGYGALRTAVGTALLAAPRLLARLEPSSTPTLARGLGLRDLLVGVATMRTTPSSWWRRGALVAGAACDTTDALLFLSRYRHTRRTSTLLVVVTGAGGALTGVALASRSGRGAMRSLRKSRQ